MFISIKLRNFLVGMPIRGLDFSSPGHIPGLCSSITDLKVGVFVLMQLHDFLIRIYIEGLNFMCPALCRVSSSSLTSKIGGMWGRRVCFD